MTTPTEQRYEGNYLDALDLPEGKLVPVVIEGWTEPYAEKDSSGKPIKNGILAFKGKSKRLIVNSSNFKAMKSMHGKDPKDWIGKKIDIQRRYLDAAHGFGVNNTLCIRIIPPTGTPLLRSCAAFMGSATPYPTGTEKRPQKPKQERYENDPSFRPDPEPPPPIDELPDDEVEWLGAVNGLQTLDLCGKFREQLLPTCPASISARIEKALVAREETLGKVEQ